MPEKNNNLFCFTVPFTFLNIFLLVVCFWGPRVDPARHGDNFFIFQIFDKVVVFKLFFWIKLAASPGATGTLWAASRRGVRFVLIMEFLNLKIMDLWKYSAPHLQFAGSGKGGAACGEIKN